MESQTKISQEIAEAEVLKFLNTWLEKPIKLEEVSESYPNILNAVMDGRMTFDDENVPKYKLLNPVKNDSDEISISEVSFKTRISPTNQARLGKGLNVATDQLEFLLRCVAHIVGKTVAELDKFSKRDYNTVRETSSVFI